MLAGAALAIALCTTVATVLVVLDSGAAALGDQLTPVFGIVAAALFLGSGVLRISRWRLAGDTRSLMMGAALVVLGGLALPLTSLAGVIMGDSDSSMLRAITALATTLTTLTLVVRALNAPPTDASVHPVRIVLGGVSSSLLVFLALLAFWAIAPELMTSSAIPPPMIRGSLLAIAWFAVGLEAAMRGPQLPWAGRVAPLLGCMAVAELLRVISVVHPGAWEVTGAALVAVIACLTTHSALLDLDEAAQAELGATADVLTSNRARGNRQRARRGQPLHGPGTRSAGLRAALVTLEEYGARLDVSTKERLRSAALGEVGHLEHLIIRGERDATVDFDLEPVLRTVVETQRAMGLDVDLGDCDLQAHGRPGDVATVLQNLLVNAGQHADGRVTVRAVTVGHRVEVHVEDRGPGMPMSQVATLFQRGARGPGSDGSGLGLHVSHTLMQQQGGDLELRSHTQGCVFTLSLWAAGGPALAPVPYQRRSRRVWPRPTGAALPAE